MKRSSIPSIILSILKEVGSITTQSFFNPKYAKKYGYNYLYPNNNTYNLATSRLVKRELIKKDKDIYYLTSKGEKEAFFCYLKSNKIITNKTEQKWDGKWRIIFFDIPEKKRRYRDELRSMLRVVGFKEFQKSIWIYPYKVPEFLKEILWEESIKHYTRLITTNSIEYDKDLKNLFKLK